MLSWRLFGIQFGIDSSFWFMNALWALLMSPSFTNHPAQDRITLIFIAVWIVCALVFVTIHELGHAITAKLFGAKQPAVMLTGTGGQTITYDELSPWKRIIVYMAGPAAGFVLVTLVLLFDSDAWNNFMNYLTLKSNKEFFLDWKIRIFWIDHTPLAPWRRDSNIAYQIALNIMTFLVLFTNIMNLFPIIPLDGGMVLREVCLLITRHGLKIAFGISFSLAIVMTVFYLTLVLEKYKFLDPRLEIYYPFGFPEFSLIVFGSLAYQSYAAYRQLLIADRHSAYMEDDDDYRSGPRRLPPGVVEVEPKDPDDFAPPAPGSERPRR